MPVERYNGSWRCSQCHSLLQPGDSYSLRTKAPAVPHQLQPVPLLMLLLLERLLVSYFQLLQQVQPRMPDIISCLCSNGKVKVKMVLFTTDSHGFK